MLGPGTEQFGFVKSLFPGRIKVTLPPPVSNYIHYLRTRSLGLGLLQPFPVVRIRPSTPSMAQRAPRLSSWVRSYSGNCRTGNRKGKEIYLRKEELDPAPTSWGQLEFKAHHQSIVNRLLTAAELIHSLVSAHGEISHTD